MDHSDEIIIDSQSVVRRNAEILNLLHLFSPMVTIMQTYRTTSQTGK
jgi:hypothetical protein